MNLTLEQKAKAFEQLNELIKNNEEFMKKYQQFTHGSFNEFNERCKLERANRIGKNKEKL